MRDALKTRQLPVQSRETIEVDGLESDVLFNPLDSYITKIPIYIHLTRSLPCQVFRAWVCSREIRLPLVGLGVIGLWFSK